MTNITDMKYMREQMLILAKDHDVIEDMCSEYDQMIGCWGCRYFDNFFGKQISCPFETFDEHITISSQQELEQQLRHALNELLNMGLPDFYLLNICREELEI